MQLIANELKEYPNIALQWKEVGLSFQIQFVRLDYIAEQIEEAGQEQKVPSDQGTKQKDSSREQAGSKQRASKSDQAGGT